MSVKTTYELCKSLELNKEQIKGLDKAIAEKPINQTPAERQNELCDNSQIRFMDYYADVVFSIANVIEKHPERISTDKNKIAGNEYAVIKTTRDDFVNYLFEDMNIFKHEFIKKLNAIADNAPSIWITEKTPDGEQKAKSIYPILVFRDLKTNKRYNGLANNKGVIAELQIAFNKELFIGNYTNGLTESFRLLPDKLPTTIKEYLKETILCCLNSNGDILKLEEKQLFKFFIFLKNHYNGKDFLQNPADLFKVVNPRLLNNKGHLKNTESFYLYLLMYIYAYNDLFIQDKLDGYNIILTIPFWDGKKIRIPTEKLAEMETVNKTIENYGQKTKTTITQEKKGHTKAELKKLAKQANDEIMFTMDHYTNTYAMGTMDGYQDAAGVRYPSFKRAKITFYEYLQDVENIPLTDVYNNLQNEQWANDKRKNYVNYLKSKDLFKTATPIDSSTIMSKLIIDNYFIMDGADLLKADLSNMDIES
jgi:hypothetical protein